MKNNKLKAGNLSPKPSTPLAGDQRRQNSPHFKGNNPAKGIAGYVPASRRAKSRLGEKGWRGTPSDYLRHLDDMVREQPGCPVVLLCRVSTPSQERHGNLSDQIRDLRSIAEKMGLLVVGVVTATRSGSLHENRSEFARAVKIAARSGAIVLAESTARFIRNRGYHPNHNPNAKVTVREFEQLRDEAGMVVLATVLHPDANWRAVREHERSRGQDRGPVEPGTMVFRRRQKLPNVLRLHRAGLSQYDITLRTGVARTTVRDWIAKYAY